MAQSGKILTARERLSSYVLSGLSSRQKRHMGYFRQEKAPDGTIGKNPDGAREILTAHGITSTNTLT